MEFDNDKKDSALLISKTLHAVATLGVANLFILMILMLCLLTFTDAIEHFSYLNIFWFIIFVINIFLVIQAWHLYLDAKLFIYLSNKNDNSHGLNKIDSLILKLFGRNLSYKSFDQRYENSLKKINLFLKYSIFNLIILLIFIIMSGYLQFYPNP